MKRRRLAPTTSNESKTLNVSITVEHDDLVTALPLISPLEETVRTVEHNSHFDVADYVIRRRFGPERNKGGAVGLLFCDKTVHPENVLKLTLGMAIAIDVYR